MEINTRSFPFSYEIRKQMILESFNYHKNIHVLGDYAFLSPYIQYFPPFVSPAFKRLKNKIILNIRENSFITYTGDRAERVLLSLFGFNPVKANRQVISSTNVKNLLYKSVLSTENLYPNEGSKNNDLKWHEYVSPKVGQVIEDNWNCLLYTSDAADD